MSTLDIDTTPLAWASDAACVSIGTAIFYPPAGAVSGFHYAQARAVCNTCPVAAQCLEFALDNDERHGMWGGHSPEQRDRILKARGKRRTTGQHKRAAEERAKSDALLPRYEALIAANGNSVDLAAELGITTDALNKRMERARRRRERHEGAA